MNPITRQDILAHQSAVPWAAQYQVEQDLLLCQTMVALFDDKFLGPQIAMRGGTLLRKVHLSPAARYSEDLWPGWKDYGDVPVQVNFPSGVVLLVTPRAVREPGFRRLERRVITGKAVLINAQNRIAAEVRPPLFARKAGANVVSCRPGRGGQLNSGAAEPAGDILLFLHADTRLPQDCSRLVRRALKDPEVAGGSFALRFEPCPPLLKINEVTANWRARLFHLPFGDQAIFVRSALFRLLGGYRDLPLMEDVEFARRLHRAGRTAFLLSPVRTSPRRYSGGYWRRNLINKVVFAGYFMGVPPDRLAKMYGRGDPAAGA